MILKKTKLNAFLVTLICIFFFITCSQKVITVKHPDKVKTDNHSANKIEKKYLNEGFINNSLFRIVILSESSDTGYDIEEIKDKARKRALTSLQNYLRLKGRNVTHNVRAELLNLIDTKSYFKKVMVNHKKNGVYYLEIQQSNIKRYLENISSH